MTNRDPESKRSKSSSRWITTENAMFMCIEALVVATFILTVITLVAGRYSHSLQGSPILTFDTSSVKTNLADQGILNASKVQDWYEPHYLSVCKGSWQPGGTHHKNASSTVCMEMSAGYTFSLCELLAADAGIPADSPLLSIWSFAVLRTEMPFVCLTIAMTFVNMTWITYLFCIIFFPGLTSESPLYWHRVGYLESIAAYITMILSSAKITAVAQHLLDAKPAAYHELIWSTAGFYVLTWLPIALLSVVLILSIILAFRLRPAVSSRLS